MILSYKFYKLEMRNCLIRNAVKSRPKDNLAIRHFRKHRLIPQALWFQKINTHTHTHTHTRLTALFSGTTRVSGYQKVKTNLAFSEVRDSEWHWHQPGHVCTRTYTAHRSRQITTPVPCHSVFYTPDALPASQPTASKH